MFDTDPTMTHLISDCRNYKIRLAAGDKITYDLYYQDVRIYSDSKLRSLEGYAVLHKALQVTPMSWKKRGAISALIALITIYYLGLFLA